MSLSLSCPCGARFEVEESLARQTVSCPECQQPVQAPAVTRRPLRTSGWAVTGVVTGLVLAFTGIGTILAILFGILALVSISRNPGQVGRSIDSVQGEVVARFRDSNSGWDAAFNKRRPKLTNLYVRENKRLTPAGGLERAELLLDVKVEGAWITFLIRLVRDPDTNQGY